MQQIGDREAMTNQLTESIQRADNWIWAEKLSRVRGPRRLLLWALRLLYVLVREVGGGQLNLRAMSLVYTTLLSVVPLLAVSFSVLKGFGVHNQIEPILFNFLEPLGPKGMELGQQVIGFVENVRVGVLGSLGLGLLIYTVISLIQKIESAFNYVWQVERLRSLSQRFSNYLSVILIGPVLVFSALGITASVMSLDIVQKLLTIEPFGRLFVLATKLVPYLLICVAFTFIYIFIPNTRVRFVSAVTGALVGGVLWQSTGWAFAAFIASSSKYAAIYSSFAILILLLIWLYLNWLILLLGAQVAFFVQHPQYLVKEPVKLVLSNRLRERLGLQILYHVALHHYCNEKPWTLDDLIEHLQIPGEPVGRVLDLLIDGGYLVETSEEPPTYLPRRDIGTMRLYEVIAGLRRAGESPFLRYEHLPELGPVEQVMEKMRISRDETLGELTMRDLVGRESPPATAGDQRRDATS
jgi:membrane protein